MSYAAPNAIGRCVCGLEPVPVWVVGTQQRCITCLVEYARKQDEQREHYNCNRRLQRKQAALDDCEAELLRLEVEARDQSEELERLRGRLADFIRHGEV